MKDPIELKRDTIEIQGGRKLYNYTFEVNDDATNAPAEAKEKNSEESETNE